MGFTYQKNAAGEFVCPHCNAVKKNQNTMHYHLKKHDGQLPHACKHCDKRFLQAQTLANHIAARHSDIERAALPCPCCEFTTVTKSNRIIHFVRKHCQEALKDSFMMTDEGHFTCTACSKVCKSSTAFHYHVAGCLTLEGETQQQLATIMA